MIETPTVFILGAGASVHLGFPTGPGLIRDICEHSKGSSSVLEKLEMERATLDGRLRAFLQIVKCRPQGQEDRKHDNHVT